MAEHEKDTPRQAALRRQIESHPIWQYPPEERLQHNREWQSLYLQVFEFKTFLQQIENRLQNTDASAMAKDEAALRDARYTRRSKLRGKLDTLTFTQAMRTAVAKFDAGSGAEFMAYFDAIYANAMHRTVNTQANREQGDVSLTAREGKLWKQMVELCEKMGVDARRLPEPFYKKAADSLEVDEEALRRLVRNVTSARYTVSLNETQGKDTDAGPLSVADPRQEALQTRLERTTEAMRVLAMFAGKDVKEYPRLFFTTDVLGPLCEKAPAYPPELYCALLEKQEDLLWGQIFVRGYINFLFEPHHPERLRVLPDTPLAHPLQDSSVAAYQHVTAAAVSNQRKRYTALLKKMLEQMEES